MNSHPYMHLSFFPRLRDGPLSTADATCQAQVRRAYFRKPGAEETARTPRVAAKDLQRSHMPDAFHCRIMFLALDTP
jgi:hypothetical protein